MHEKIAPGMVVIAALLGLLGGATVLANLGAIVLGLDRAPAWMAAFGLLYGGVAILTAVLVWSQSPWARWAFVGWSALVLCAGIILQQYVEIWWHLIPGMLALLVAFVAIYRYIDRTCRARAHTGP